MPNDKVRYLLRVFYCAIPDEKEVKNLLKFIREAKIDEVMLFSGSYTLEPNLLKEEILKKRARYLKEIVPKVRRAGATAAINVLSTIGHIDAGSRVNDKFPFQFMVNEYGQTAGASVCPLDRKWQSYILSIYSAFAETGADIIWVDDDFRYLIHDIPGMTCFCPLHMEELSHKIGRRINREELVSELKQNNFDLKQQWFKVLEEAMLNAAGIIEKAVHGANPKMRIGLMTIGTAFHGAEGRHTDKLLRTLNGNTVPLIRTGSGFYPDWTPVDLIRKTEDCARQISFIGKDVECVAEVENNPYSWFGKSRKILRLEFILNILAGMPNLSLNLFSDVSPFSTNEPGHADFLKSVRPYIDAVGASVKGKERIGIGILDSENYALHSKVRTNNLQELIQFRLWEIILARMGFPIGKPVNQISVQGKLNSRPHLVTGDMVLTYSVPELDRMFKEGVVVDAIAAQNLVARNLGKRFGLVSINQVSIGVNEKLTDDSINGKDAGKIIPTRCHIGYSSSFTVELEKKRGRVLSHFIDINGDVAGNAACLLDSDDGDRLAIIPIAMHSGGIVEFVNLTRQNQMGNIFKWAVKENLPCRILNTPNVYPVLLAEPSLHELIFAVANISFDDMDNVPLEASILKEGRWTVDRLFEQGKWKSAPRLLTSKGGVPVLSFHVKAWEAEVLRLTRTK